MKNTRLRLLLQPSFIASLIILVVNDLRLKHAFSNWLTGKLSDFAGMFAFGLFLLAFFPRHRKTVLVWAGLFFAWWKSPLSDSFIYTCNDAGIMIGRVVDMTDLLALTVLPLCYRCACTTINSVHGARPWLTGLLAFAAFTAFCSTVLAPRPIYHYPDNYVRVEEEYYSKKTPSQLFQNLEQKGIVLKRGNHKYFPLMQPESVYYRVKTNDSVRYEKIIKGDKSDTALYVQASWSNGFYLMEKYMFEGQPLYNLTFSIDTSYLRRFRSEVFITSFETDHKLRMDLYKSKNMRKLKRHLKKLLLGE